MLNTNKIHISAQILTPQQFKEKFPTEYQIEQIQQKEEKRFKETYNKLNPQAKEIYNKLNTMISNLYEAGVDVSYFPDSAKYELINTALNLEEYMSNINT